MSAFDATSPPACKRPKLEAGQELPSHDSAVPESSDDKTLKVNGNAKEHQTTVAIDINNNCSILPFHQFSVDRVLFTDPRSKTICVLGNFNDSPDLGVIIAEKQPLTESSIPHLFSSTVQVKKKFQNDIYSQYVLDCREKGGVGEVRVTTVYPATEKHVKKYSSQKFQLVMETPENYQKITKPFAEKQSLSLDVSDKELWQLSLCIL